ncbi:MAG: ABC transporter substrate-binding protein [Janthinobacterium lividum]
MDRRVFLGVTGAALGGLALGSRAARAADRDKVGYQFSWIKNFQFAGEYVADSKGYFRQAGVEVDLMAGGPTLPVEPVVVSGRALIGQGSPDNTASANARGAGLRIIGACYQKSPFAIISMTKTGLNAPKDMVGKRIGVQGSNSVIWNAFLKINEIDPRSIETVPVQFDYSPLVSGEVDGFFGFSNDGVTHLRHKGDDVTYFLCADHGYKLMTATYMVLASSLSDPAKRARITAFMTGDIRGWQDVVTDPTLAARLTVDTYGKGNGLDEATEREACALTNELMVSDVTRAHGLFWMSDEAVAETIQTLAAASVRAVPEMFTNEILADIYRGRASL